MQSKDSLLLGLKDDFVITQHYFDSKSHFDSLAKCRDSLYRVENDSIDALIKNPKKAINEMMDKVDKIVSEIKPGLDSIKKIEESKNP